MAEAAAAFRSLLFSRWGAVLAVGFGAAPALALILALTAFRAPGVLAGVQFSLGGIPTFLVAIVLLAMLALDELRGTARPLAAFLGRLGALAVLVSGATLLPVLSAAFLPGSLPQAVLPALVALLECSALLAVATLFAQLGHLRAAFGFAAFLAFALVVAPDLAFLAILGPGSDGVGVWTSALAALSPGTASAALLRAIFPERDFIVAEATRLDHPLFFSPVLWSAILLAWTLVPLAMVAFASRGTPEPDDAEPA